MPVGTPAGTNNGPITRETVFDKFVLELRSLSDSDPQQFAYLYSRGQQIGWVEAANLYRHHIFDESDPEVIEIQRRLDAGEATLHYQLPRSTEVRPWNELQSIFWHIPTAFPFHERGVDPHHFFDGLARGT